MYMYVYMFIHRVKPALPSLDLKRRNSSEAMQS